MEFKQLGKSKEELAFDRGGSQAPDVVSLE